jgi:hypothetical protein
MSLLWLVSTAGADASILRVETNGIDSATCGSNQSPCRSISQAIENAVAGDTIVVGPGRYGDANNDGDFNDPGDEHAEVGVGCYCVLKVAKAVRIESSRGSEMTVIDSPSSLSIEQIVQITASDAFFGRLNHGFLIAPSPPGGPGISTGIAIVAGEHVTVGGNQIVGANGRAIRVEGSTHVVVGNVVTHSAIGLYVIGSRSVIEGNVFEANNVGGDLDGTGHQVSGNVFVGNRAFGLQLAGDGHLIRRNAFLANLDDGVRVLATNTTITENNIYGNACGLRNGSGSVTEAPKNFWGDALGPGPDPADEICDVLGSVTNWQPPATTLFQINIQ